MFHTKKVKPTLDNIWRNVARILSRLKLKLKIKPQTLSSINKNKYHRRIFTSAIPERWSSTRSFMKLDDAKWIDNKDLQQLHCTLIDYNEKRERDMPYTRKESPFN